MDDLKTSILPLHKRTQTLHPIAVIAIKHAIDVSNLGMVNVPTNHAIKSTLFSLLCYCQLKVGNKVDCFLDLQLQVRRKTPVRPAPATAQTINPSVHSQREFVKPVPNIGKPFRCLDDAIEIIAMNHPQTFAVLGDVLGLTHYLNTPEGMTYKMACKLVVIARNVDDMTALANPAKQLLDHIVVCLWPMPPSAQSPTIHDVSDQVQLFAGMVS